MSSQDELLDFDPFDFSDKARQAFYKALSETTLHHYENCEFIKFYYDRLNYKPLQKIENEQQVNSQPFLPVNLFKYVNLQSCTNEEIALKLTSSGTSGQKSQMILDHGSLERVKQLAYNVYASLGITSKQKCNYICFTYDPKVANDLGTAFTDELLTSFTGIGEVFYTFVHNGTDFVFEKEKTKKKLIEFSKKKEPVRILGFPAFLYDLLSGEGLNLNLGKDSWLLSGGGWKGRAEQEIPKAEFKKLVHQKLGIPVENMRDLFGMVEHGIPFVECDKSLFRVPNYGRVIVRDPISFEILPYGKVGVLQFICAYNTSYPSFNYLGTDLGRLEAMNDGKGDALHLLGRASKKKKVGCAIKALEMMD